MRIRIPEWVRGLGILLLLAVGVPFALILIQTYIDTASAVDAQRANPAQEEGTR